MNMADSPFKRAELEPIGAIPPCSVNSGCTAASSNVNLINNNAVAGQPLDLSKNPFLSGNYVAQASPQPAYIHTDGAAGCTHAQPIVQPIASSSGNPYYNTHYQAASQVVPVAKPLSSNEVVNSVNVISSNDVSHHGNGNFFCQVFGIKQC